MIAYTEEEVLKRRSDQDARLNQQQQEAQDKEDQAFADKAEKRRQEQIATNRSRQQQQQQRGIALGISMSEDKISPWLDTSVDAAGCPRG